jgi:hypothetical protein
MHKDRHSTIMARARVLGPRNEKPCHLVYDR